MSEAEKEKCFDISDLAILKLFLQRLTKEEIVSCREVCPQWKKMIDEIGFWRAKEERDGEVYIRSFHDEGIPILCVGLEISVLSIKKPFNRNLLSDNNVNAQDDVVRSHADYRWRFSHIDKWTYLLDKIHPDDPSLFEGCHETNSSNYHVSKYMELDFERIGISRRFIDVHHPPLYFSEWVANKPGSSCSYRSLIEVYNGNNVRIGHAERVYTAIPSEDQRWQKIELILQSYPPGARKILITTIPCYTQAFLRENIEYGCLTAASHFEIKMEQSPYPEDV